MSSIGTSSIGTQTGVLKTELYESQNVFNISAKAEQLKKSNRKKNDFIATNRGTCPEISKNLNISSGEAEIETDDMQNERSSPMKEEVNNRKKTKA